MGSSAFKTEPSLSVFAPTSKLVATDKSRLNRSETSNSSVAVSPPLQGSSNETGLGDQIAGPNGDSQMLDLPDSGTPKMPVIGLLAGVIYGLPSWAVSLIVHLALILTLALYTFGASEGDQILKLEFADSPAEFQALATEIEFDEIVLEDTTETLDTEQSEMIQDQELDVSLAFSEEFSNDFLADLSPREFVQVTTGGPETGVPAASSSNESKSANFFGTKSYGSRFVFVIDCSLSMKGNRWYHAVKELNTAIDGLNSDQEFTVLLYNEATAVMLNADPDKLKLVQATQDNRDSYRRWIRKQRPNGGTFPADAMFLALGLDPDAIFLLSDGELQDNTHRLLPFWNMPLERSNGIDAKIPVHTVSLGSAGQGQEMMRTIAEQNDGEFKWIK